MPAIFLDYATVSFGDDLDQSSLRRVLPGLETRDHTAQDEVAERIAGTEVVLVNKLRIAVCNLRDYCTASVVQHVFGVLLFLTQAPGIRRAGALGRMAARRTVLPARPG